MTYLYSKGMIPDNIRVHSPTEIEVGITTGDKEYQMAVYLRQDVIKLLMDKFKIKNNDMRELENRLSQCNFTLTIQG